MSIRTRISLLITCLLTLSLCVMSIAIYGIQRKNMMSQLENGIVQTADRLMGPLKSPAPQNNQNPHPDAAAEVDGTEVPRQDDGNQPPPPDASMQPGPPNGGHLSDRSPEDFDNMYQTKQSPVFDIVNILDLDGKLIYSPVQRNSQEIPVSDSNLTLLKQGRNVWQDEKIDQNDYLVYVTPVTQNEEIIGFLQVGRPLSTVSDFLNSLAKGMLVIGLCEILASAAIGWYVSGTLLKKIDEITRTADAIREEQDFSKRVIYTGPPDEIGALAAAFNEMLENIQSTYERLKESLVQQRNFVADVSHELRTPLTTISGNLALLGSGKKISAEDQQDMIHDMSEESERLTRLVNELLTLARAEMEEKKLCLRPLKLRPLIDECVRQLNVLDPQRLVSIAVAEDLVVLSERTKLKQLLIILLDNAYKHADGDIRVEAEQSGPYTNISVIDYGKGIPTEQMSTIFERFHKSENSGNGFGLGLPIAKSLAKSLNADLEAASDPEAWTCFTVKLYPEQENYGKS